MAVLVTGGAGFIGSHTLVELLSEGEDAVVVDDLSNSNAIALERVRAITERGFRFYKSDVCDDEGLGKVFAENKIDSCIHFAGLKSVGESIKKPLEYYKNNVAGTVGLCKKLFEYGAKRIVFSSSATVYGEPKYLPIDERHPIGKTENPYGESKKMIEKILTDVSNSDREWSVMLLRYFNPIGAHKSGLIGEDPNGIPNNLMPYIAGVAAGKFECLKVFGNDYDTPDGTGVRDYIHVSDLARAHIKALEYVRSHKGVEAINLGTGRGYSVLELVEAYERASGKQIPYKIVKRRDGDVGSCYANADKAARLLGWRAERGIDEMCADMYRWQSMNPDGYK